MRSYTRLSGFPRWKATVSRFNRRGSNCSYLLGCLLLSLLFVTPALAGPVISNFTPTSGPVGTKITVNGSGFGTTTNVTFTGGASAAFFKVSAFQLQVTVPSGALSGPITITNSTGPTTSSQSFTLTAGITGFTPAAGPVGTTVTINGSDLQGVTGVTFNGVSATTFSSNPQGTQLSAVVPDGATSGPIGVTTGAGTVTSSTPFRVLPRIDSFSPNIGPEGTIVTITGKNFTNPNVILVRFYNVSTTFTIVSDTEITAPVPVGAQTGIIALSTNQGTVYSSMNFYVAADAAGAQPTVTTVTNGSVGSVITVNGSNFGYSFNSTVNDVVVTFPEFDPSVVPSGVDLDPGTPGIQVAPNSVAGTSLKVTVPFGATHGPISVTNAFGTATSSGNFILIPKITGYTPNSGFPGDSILIEGTGLSALGAPTAIDPPVVKFYNGQTSLSVTPDTSSPSNQYTHLTAVVPTLATTGPVTVQTSASGTGTGPTFTVGPRITGISPLTGPAGTIVTVTGANFVPNATSIRMYAIVSGNPAYVGISSFDIVASSITSISFKVPNHSALATGPISIVTPAGTATSDGTQGSVLAYFVPVGKLPTITDFGNAVDQSPAPVSGTMTDPPVRFGAAGTRVVITGTNFTPTGMSVTFNGVATGVTVTFIDSTTIVATAATGLTAGPIRVTNPFGTSAPSTLDYAPAAPTLTTGLTPNYGPVGTLVSVTGANYTRQTEVYFTGADGTTSVQVPAANVEWISATTLRVPVPAAAKSGPVRVKTVAGEATSTINFSVVGDAPVISDFNDDSAPTKQGGVGTIVHITGSNFLGATQVYFNTTAANITAANINGTGTQIDVAAPTGFTTGPLRVNSPAGTSAPTTAQYVLAAPGVPTFTVQGLTNVFVAPTDTLMLVTSTNLTENSQVRFTGADGVPVSGVDTQWVSATQIRTRVPNTALLAPGPIYVTNEAIPTFDSGNSSTWGTASTVNFFPADAVPVITDFNDATAPTKMGAAGTPVTITGSNFKGASQVYFNTTAVTLTAAMISADGTSITVNAPAGFTAGPLRVINAAGPSLTTAESYVPALPTITSITPNAGPAGMPVVIAGTNFSTNSQVFFTGLDGVTQDVEATNVSWIGNTSLRAIVPSGVFPDVAKPISVTNEGGSTTSVATFTLKSSAPVVTDFGNTTGNAKYGPAGTNVTITGSGFTGVTGTTAVQFVLQPNSTAVNATSVVVVDDNTITANVPAGAGAYQIRVNHPTNGTGNSVDSYIIGASTAVEPTITSFTPQTGPVGTTITVTGTRFSPSSKVYFSKTGDTTQRPTNLANNFVFVSQTSIRADVPANTVTGAIRVVNEAGSSGPSVQYFVPAGAAPVISNFTPEVGPIGTMMVVNGDNFIPTSTVQFTTTAGPAAGTAQALTLAQNAFISRNQIRVMVPSGTIIGPIRVNNPGLATGGTLPAATVSYPSALSANSFTPQDQVPTITSFTPQTGPEGTTITITGNYFGPYSTVQFTSATGINLQGDDYTFVSATSARVNVPAGTRVGPITVTNAAGTSAPSTQYFVPSDRLPIISDFTPKVARPGDTITITGDNFTPTSIVQFSSTTVLVGGTLVYVNAAGNTFVSRNEIRVVVPSGVAAGPIRVYNALVTSTTPAVTATLSSVPSAANFVPFNAKPYITGVLPAFSNITTMYTGTVGSDVIVTGANFTPDVQIRFSNATGINLLSPKVVWLSNTSVRAEVPAGVVVGPLNATTEAGTSDASSIHFVPTLATAAAIPTVTSVSPASGGGGTRVIINGTNFTPQSTVSFNSPTTLNALDVRYVSKTQLEATVPLSPTTGPVRVLNAGTQANGTFISNATVNFTVTAGQPSVTAISNANAAAGTNITLTGINFLNANAVYFTGDSGLPNVAGSIVGTPTATSITVTVPALAKIGPIVVQTPSAASNPSEIHFVPSGEIATVTGLSPSTGLPGTAITITGTGFTPQSQVFFNNGTFAGQPLTLKDYRGLNAYISPTQIVVTVPVGTTTGKIKVSSSGAAFGLSALSTQDFVAADAIPAVTGFSVNPAAVGANINITGVNLLSATDVMFTGATGLQDVPATIVGTPTATSITVTVPVGAKVGPVTVTTPAGESAPGAVVATAALSQIYFVPTGEAPTITSISTQSAPIGTVLTINGTNFTPQLTAAAATTVQFNNGVGTAQALSLATNSFINSGQIKVVVPAGTTVGTVKVNTMGGSALSPQIFVATERLPVVTAISANPAAPGATITLTGTGFLGTTAITFTDVNGDTVVDAPVFTVVSDTSLSVQVPTDAKIGPITVTTPAGTSAEGAVTAAGRVFFVATTDKPEITTVTPTVGPLGTWVTITGRGFTPQSQVKFNNGTGTAQLLTAAGNAFLDRNTIRVAVPTGTTTGTLTVSATGTLQVSDPSTDSFTDQPGAP